MKNTATRRIDPRIYDSKIRFLTELFIGLVLRKHLGK